MTSSCRCPSVGGFHLAIGKRCDVSLAAEIVATSSLSRICCSGPNEFTILAVNIVRQCLPCLKQRMQCSDFRARRWNHTFLSIVLYMGAPRARTWRSQSDTTPNGLSIPWPQSSLSTTSWPLPYERNCSFIPSRTDSTSDCR